MRIECNVGVYTNSTNLKIYKNVECNIASVITRNFYLITVQWIPVICRLLWIL